ncbi:hypothetical protein L211DRAFT_68193 [Terfezia boudieri ATCC MYA-4762]|uniref:Uncharacterized protein n=1 Tax=Terfezia boudieri ATCC MYA-4762 TaxID=1051890 RepID=A0A3N4LSV3_9PEZI|nr:hypothetical protein L211DRAFT_68193 [Terfezia boudieri ATCC MYA-4762]
MVLHSSFLRRDTRSEPALSAVYESKNAQDTVLAPPTLPIFVHGSLMLPEMLLIYLNKETITQAGGSALDMGTIRHANDPLVVCPATIHGYHRRQYNEKPLEPQQPQATQEVMPLATHEKGKKPKRRSFAHLIRKKSFRWSLFQRSRPEGDPAELDVDQVTDTDDDQLGGLLFPYVLPGPNFESKVDGILFYPRSKEEYDNFIQTFNKDHTDEDDGETIVGVQVLDVEVFLDDAFEQRGSRTIRMNGGKVNHHCWHFIKDFDLHQRDDGNRRTNQDVPEVRHFVQLTPGFRDNAVIEKAFYPSRFVHPDEEDNTLTAQPALAMLWGLPNAAISGQSITGIRGSTIVKAIVFIAGTIPACNTEHNQILRSAVRQRGRSRPHSPSSLSTLAGLAKGMKRSAGGGAEEKGIEEDENEVPIIVRRRRAGYNRAGLLDSGEKWRMTDFREFVVPRLILGVEKFHQRKAKIVAENERGILRGRLRKWESYFRKKKEMRINEPEDENLLEKEEFVYQDEKNQIKKEEKKKGREIKRAGKAVEEGADVRRRSGGAWLWSQLFGARVELREMGTKEMGDVEAGVAGVAVVGEVTREVFSGKMDSALLGSWFGNWRLGGQGPNGLVV